MFYKKECPDKSRTLPSKNVLLGYFFKKTFNKVDR